jgi:acyl-CoA thioesterase II
VSGCFFDIFDDLTRLELTPGVFEARMSAASGSVPMGGFLLAQAVLSAAATVGDGGAVHALHGRFPQAGIADEPVVFRVEAVRDGRSFGSRLVRAMQGDRILLLADVSFRTDVAVQTGAMARNTRQPADPAGADRVELRWARPPAVPLAGDPDEAPAQTPVATYPLFARYFDVRAASAASTIPAQTFHPFWIRHREQLPDDAGRHAAGLAHLTDVGMSGSALPPSTPMRGRFGSVTLDHAVWFHVPCRLDEWLHVAVEPTFAGDGRVFARGEVRTRDGTLVASTAQEAWRGSSPAGNPERGARRRENAG